MICVWRSSHGAGELWQTRVFASLLTVIPTDYMSAENVNHDLFTQVGMVGLLLALVLILVFQCSVGG
jgi:hypothetical protein